jgi:hypothetical protein
MHTMNKYGGLEVQIQLYVELNGHFYALDASPPKLKKSLAEKSPAGNDTTIPQLPKSQPSYFANYAIQPLLYTTE